MVRYRSARSWLLVAFLSLSAILSLGWRNPVLFQLILRLRERTTRCLSVLSTHRPPWEWPPTSLLHQASKPTADKLLMESWYGNSDVVGPSPYDFVPRPLQQDEQRVRLLFLLDFKDYLERMNSHSYEMYVPPIWRFSMPRRARFTAQTCPSRHL